MYVFLKLNDSNYGGVTKLFKSAQNTFFFYSVCKLLLYEEHVNAPPI